MAGGKDMIHPGEQDNFCAGGGSSAQQAAPAAFPHLAPWETARDFTVGAEKCQISRGLGPVQMPDC